jgi:hypothetical protein
MVEMSTRAASLGLGARWRGPCVTPELDPWGAAVAVEPVLASPSQSEDSQARRFLEPRMKQKQQQGPIGRYLRRAWPFVGWRVFSTTKHREIIRRNAKLLCHLFTENNTYNRRAHTSLLSLYRTATYPGVDGKRLTPFHSWFYRRGWARAFPSRLNRIIPASHNKHGNKRVKKENNVPYFEIES